MFFLLLFVFLVTLPVELFFLIMFSIVFLFFFAKINFLCSTRDYRYTMYIHITLDTFLKIYHLIYMCTLCVHLLLLKFTSSWDFVIFREYWISMDIKVKMQYLVQCTRTRVAPKNLSVMVRTGFALDQPSINGIGPINPSEKMKRSETVGNGRKHDQAKTCSTRIFLKISISRNAVFFLKVQRCPRGNGWKQSEIAPSLGKKDKFLHNFQTFFMNICYKTTICLPSEGAISDCFQPFPLGHLWTFQKKRRCAEMLIFKNMRVEQVLAWSCFRPFPTVSDRFRLFHFFWRINWTNSIYGRLIQCKTRANHDA